ncbi:hypothetical protein ACTFIV_000238 [Dictyostelium citrinum]
MLHGATKQKKKPTLEPSMICVALGCIRVKFYQNHPKINELLDCIRNENDEQLKLKEIYEFMIKDRSTLFRFISRSLPGINHERDNRCKISCPPFQRPLLSPLHLMSRCLIEKNIVSVTVNKLSFINIHRWPMDALNISKYNRTIKSEGKIRYIVSLEFHI